MIYFAVSIVKMPKDSCQGNSTGESSNNRGGNGACANNGDTNNKNDSSGQKQTEEPNKESNNGEDQVPSTENTPTSNNGSPEASTSAEEKESNGDTNNENISSGQKQTEEPAKGSNNGEDQVPPTENTPTSNNGSPEASTSAKENESDFIEKVGVPAEQDELENKEQKENMIQWFKTQLEAVDEDKESRHEFFSLPNGDADAKTMHSIYKASRVALLKCGDSHDPRIIPLLNIMEKNYRLEQEELLKKQQAEEKEKQVEDENEEEKDSSNEYTDFSESEDEVEITGVTQSKRERDRKESDSESSESSSESDSRANIRKSKRVKVKKQNEAFIYATRSSRRVQNKLPMAKRVIQRTRSKGKPKVAVAAKGKQKLKHSKKQIRRMPPKKRSPSESLLKKEIVQNVSPGGKVRRATKSRPSSISSIKDRVSRPKFEKCARQISELHGLTTFAKKKDRDRVPKSHHFMYSYDELVEKPHYAKLGVNRDTPLSAFFAPEGVDVKALGHVLMKVGQEMIKNNGRNKGNNYVVTNDKDAYSCLIFGEKMTKPKSKNKSSLKFANI